MKTRRTLLPLLILTLSTACDTDEGDTVSTQGESSSESSSGDGDGDGTDSGDGDGDTTDSGDGDGDTTTGDGDGDTTDSGDGDGDTSGDGDGDTTDSGDGDGDSTGDGDGDTTGDGDGDTTGDGDGDTTGDGDGDTTGDGDGDPAPPDPLCIDNHCTDGVQDARLNLGDPEAGGDLGLALGDHVRIFGREYNCGDSPCSSDWGVMRDMSNGELIAATFGKPVPDANFLANFGETPETWIAPLTFEWNEYDLCEPFDSGCGNNTFFQRAAVQFSADQEVGRILDRRTGWAPLGYHVGARRWESGDADCQFALWWYADMYVRRTDCEGDCPEPTFANSCEPEQPLNQIGFASFSFFDPPNGGDTHFNYDMQCLVLDIIVESESQERVILDCVPPFEG